MYRYWLLTFIQGKNLRRQVQRARDLPEGASKNSIKTGKKQGRKSREALKRKREKFTEKKKIWAAQKQAAEGTCGAFIHQASYKY